MGQRKIEASLSIMPLLLLLTLGSEVSKPEIKGSSIGSASQSRSLGPFYEKQNEAASKRELQENIKKRIRDNDDEGTPHLQLKTDIFLPLEIESDGTVEGLLIEDTEPYRGPLIIEEIRDENGNIKEIKVERVDDLVKNFEARAKTNRKLGPMAISTSSKENKKDNLTKASVLNTNKNDTGTASQNITSNFKLALSILFALIILSVLIILMIVALKKWYLGKKPEVVGLAVKRGRNGFTLSRPAPGQLRDCERYGDEGFCQSPVKSQLRSPTYRNNRKEKDIKINPFASDRNWGPDQL